MLGRLTSDTAHALLAPSARVMTAAAMPDCGVSRAASLPWSDVHWPTLLSLASFERAESQLFRLLRAAPVGAVPDDVQRAMQQIYRVAVFRSAELADAAAVVCDAFDAASITAVWLKGAALAMQSVEDFAVRSMGDLDVLVTAESLPRARAALRAAGWTDGVTADGSYDDHHHEAPMLLRGGTRLELHTSLFPPGHPFNGDQAELWMARAVSVGWGARTIRVLPPAWHVVHASVHWAWSHEGAVGSWQYLHDMHRLASRVGGGWAAVSSHAGEMAAEVPVGWALWSAVLLGGTAVPDEVVASLRGPDRPFAGVAEREWVLRAFHSPAASPSVRWSRYWWRYAMRGLGDSVRGWPWLAGRTAQPGIVEGAGSQRGGAVRRWRRHLGRLLDS